MRQVPVPEGWSDIFSGHFEPFLRLSNRKISQRRPFRHGSFHLIFLIGNLVYTLLRLFQPKANIGRKTVSVK